MHWNHRVIVSKHEYEISGDIVTETYLQLVEVYYDDKTNKPFTYCEPHMVADTVEELQELVNRFQEAIKQPVLNTEDFQEATSEEEIDE